MVLVKKRIVKKWINRYIKPLIKDMPKTKTRSVLELESHNNNCGLIRVYEENHVIANGRYVKEACIYPKSKGLLNDIKMTAEYIKKLIDTRNKVFLRVSPEYSGGVLYMRLITNSVIT